MVFLFSYLHHHFHSADTMMSHYFLFLCPMTVSFDCRFKNVQSNHPSNVLTFHSWNTYDLSCHCQCLCCISSHTYTQKMWVNGCVPMLFTHSVPTFCTTLNWLQMFFHWFYLINFLSCGWFNFSWITSIINSSGSINVRWFSKWSKPVVLHR